MAKFEWTLETDGSLINSNGNVGLWGQSWSACSLFVLAGHKARDSRLQALKTVLPIHCAVDLYAGDIHYLDGIFHMDEYILSVDHETMLPSYGFAGAASADAYKFDDNFAKNRWTQYPWSFEYLKHQLDDKWWQNRTAFFNGPFTASNPDDFSLPVFVIGSLLDGYRDAAVQLYERLKAKGVFCKLAISPSTHTLPDEAVPGPLWDWREEAVKWFTYFLAPVGTVDDAILYDNEVAVYIRSGDVDDSEVVKGHWVNLEDPHMPEEFMEKYYLSADHTLKNVSGLKIFQDIQYPKHSLKYEPTVGVEMGTWWGEAALGDMSSLDSKSLIYDLLITEDMVLYGQPEIAFSASISESNMTHGLLVNWHVRLEDVFPNGTVVHITGASINGAHSQNGYLLRDKEYDFVIKLHYTTWIFRRGHSLRLAFTNALFPMIWPSPHIFTAQLTVSSPTTYVLLPLRPATSMYPINPHEYTKERFPVYSEPDDGWYFGEGSYPYEHTVSTNDDGAQIITWKSDYYTNCYGWIISAELDYQWQQSILIPSSTVWTGYARQIYQYVGTSDKSLWEEDASGYPSLLHPSSEVPPIQREFRLETNLSVRSDDMFFYGSIYRSMVDGAGNLVMEPYSNSFKVKRIFQ